MARPLRIAFFVGTFPVVSETFILRQITGLFDLGHEVDIYADTRAEPGSPLHPEIEQYRLLERTTFMDMPPETAPWEMPVWPLTGQTWLPGAETHIPNWRRVSRAVPKLIRCAFASPRLTRQVLSRAEFGYQAASMSALYRLAKLSAVSRRYDVLHAHFGPVGNSFRFARELWRAPLVVSFHGHDFSTLPRKEGAGMYRQLFAAADAVTVNSEFTRKQVEKLGCPPAKLQKLPVGLDPERFEFRARTLQLGEPFRILTVARLVDIKGHEYAIRAVARLRERFPETRYDIVGDGPLRPKLAVLIRELGLAETVTLHGALNGGAVKELMAAAHAFVLASANVEGDQEGQGLVLQEAQAAGLPVVATRHGAFPEGLLSGESGFLVPERDPAALAERLGDLAAHPDTWPQLGRKGRAFVEQHYDIRDLNRQLVEVYEEALELFHDGRRRDNRGKAS